MSDFSFGFGDSGGDAGGGGGGSGGGGGGDFSFGFGDDKGGGSSSSSSSAAAPSSASSSSKDGGFSFGDAGGGGGDGGGFGFGDFGASSGSSSSSGNKDKDKKDKASSKPATGGSSSGGDGGGFSFGDVGGDSGGFGFGDSGGGGSSSGSSGEEKKSSDTGFSSSSGSGSPTVAAAGGYGGSGESLRDEASRLKKKTVADIIALWNRDLEEHISAFTEQALEVKKWDQHIFETGNDIVALQRSVLNVREEQQELNNVLETIRVDQQDLVSYVGRLEESLGSMGQRPSVLAAAAAAQQDDLGRRLPMLGAGAQNDARRREESYQRAADVNQQLRQMENSLHSIVRDLNQTAERQVDQNSPMAQILKILNGQFQSLQWIETHTAELGQRIQFSRKRLQQAQELGGRRY